MKVRPAHGDAGLGAEADPAVTTAVEPPHHPGAADGTAAFREASRRPMTGPPARQRVRPGQTVAIPARDGTRPQSRRPMIPDVPAELDGIIRPEAVVNPVAPGPAGPETVLVPHDAKRGGAPRATWGTTRGNPVHDDVRAVSRPRSLPARDGPATPRPADRIRSGRLDHERQPATREA
ncbi:hypothetical protein [Streptomyces sp. NPDC004284]|uniref:hypothetical protein n=1 Tax=Streptomyces sp. NPDC004284 TaxID=3364695 RepID=UPI0036C628A1